MDDLAFYHQIILRNIIIASAIFLTIISLLPLLYIASLGLKPETQYRGFWLRAFLLSIFTFVTGMLGLIAMNPHGGAYEDHVVGIFVSNWLAMMFIMRRFLKFKFRNRDPVSNKDLDRSGNAINKAAEVAKDHADKWLG